MSVLNNYLMIMVTISFIVDYSGVVGSVKRMIHKFINGSVDYIPFSLKPFDCSLCMSFWVLILYGFVWTDQSIIVNLFYASVGAYFTRFITEALNIIYILYNFVLNKLNK